MHFGISDARRKIGTPLHTKYTTSRTTLRHTRHAWRCGVSLDVDSDSVHGWDMDDEPLTAAEYMLHLPEEPSISPHRYVQKAAPFQPSWAAGDTPDLMSYFQNG